jgi:hypothetical protein
MTRTVPATGLRFAPSEVGLSLGRQNLDHNSTGPMLTDVAFFGGHFSNSKLAYFRGQREYMKTL